MRRPAADRAPFDWYVEPSWAVEALFDAVPMLGRVGDPACGMGTIPTIACERGFEIVATDIVDRGYSALTAVADFLTNPGEHAGVENIVMNPPYSYRPNIAEMFARQALAVATQTVAILVPIKWMASEVRFTFFNEHTPYEILHFSERPSMPPGHLIEQLGAKAFRRGKVDYCWVVWKIGFHGVTSAKWLSPRPKAAR